MTRSLTIFFLFLIRCAGGSLFAQAVDCPPGAPGVSFCEQACVRCDFTEVSDKLGGPISPVFTVNQCNFGTPPITLENPRWYAFIAGTNIVTFSLKSVSCTPAGPNLEYAVVPACDKPYRALICGQFDPADPNILLFGLIVGNVYYIAIDGLNAADCTYTLSLSSGSAKAPELGDILPIQGLSEVCPKATTTYTIPPVQYALSYTWIAPAGSKINGGGNVRVIPAIAGTAVSIEFGSAGGNLCVTASNNCDTPKTTCLPIVNLKLPPNDLPDMTLCFEELPYIWDQPPNNFISTPGTYTFTSSPYTSYLGCDSTVRQKIVVKPRKFKNLPPTWLCRDECLRVGDFDFCESGSYSEHLPAEDGCDSVVNFLITKIPVHASVKLPIDTITCRVPSIVLRKDSTTIVGNQVTYRWIDNQGNTVSITDTAVVSAPGEYSLIATNYGGGRACADTSTVVVPFNTTAPISNAGPNRVLTCEEAVIQLQGSGSTGSQYTYLWLALNGGNIVSGASTLTPTINATGTYRLRVTNQVNGCTATDNTIVSAQQLPPTLSATGGTYSCLVPTVNLQSTTNANTPTFAWTGPNGFTSAAQNPAVNAAGDYTVVVTDGVTGCANTATATVVANTAPPGATAAGGTLTCVINSVALSGGSPAPNPTFLWSGPNGFTSTEANPAASASGAYLLTVTGTNGCTSTAAATVSLDNTPPGATLSVANNLNCNNATVNITAGSTAPPAQVQHLWTRPDNSTVSTGANPVLAAATPGIYSIVITDNQNGCTSTATATVNQTPAVTAAIAATTNVLCFGQQNGSATVTAGGGNGTFTYAWNTSANTATLGNIGVGTYTVTVTDGENCTATATASVTQPTLLTANTAATPQMANGAADGTVTANPAGGTPAYTYEWSTGDLTPTVNGLLPGAYTVTVTDANGCTAIAIASVSGYNCTTEASITATDASCFEANDGQATAVTTNGVAPFTYLWSTGDTTASITNLAPGIYSVVVTDEANCPEAAAVTISEPNLLKANATSVNMSGPATSDGSAEASPTGGTGPYTYLWSNDETTAIITGLTAGLYTVTVTDEHGCTAVQTVEVLAGNCGISTNFIPAQPLCNGAANGSATIVLNGGTGPFTYTWSSGDTTETATNLIAGTYTVTVVDANDCDITAEVTIGEPELLTLVLDNSVNTACPELPDGSATVSGGGGTGALEYTWSDTQTGPTATGLIAGTYTVTLTDGNDCTTTLEVTIDAVDTEAPVIANDNLTAALGTAGNVTLSVQSIGLDVTDNCQVSTISFVPASYNCAQLGPHEVEVTVADNAGNILVDTITVTVVDNLPPTLTCPASIIRCFGDDIVQYDAPVATDNCLGNGGMFALVSGLPSGATFPPGTTTNTYTYTDADGNIGSCTFEVTILDQLTATWVPKDDIDNQNIGSINLTVNGSLSPYTFQWFLDGVPFDSTEDLTNIGQGLYTVSITDEIGCTFVSDSIRVRSLVDTKEPDWAVGLMIVPNPTSGLLAVIFPDQLKEEVRLMVFDMTGRLVDRQSAEAPKQVDFDLTALPEGVYTILVQVNNQVLARKLVINR